MIKNKYENRIKYGKGMLNLSPETVESRCLTMSPYQFGTPQAVSYILLQPLERNHPTETIAFVE